MIYLDSAATTFQKPLSVSYAMQRAMRTMSSPGRGGYAAARAAEETAFRCRRPFDRFANRMNLRSHVKSPLRKYHQTKGIITHTSTFVKHKSTIFPSFSCAFCLFFNCQVLGHPPAF